MILLTDRMGRDMDNLIHSFEEVGEKLPVVSVTYDGYLPEGVVSPYSAILYDGLEMPRKPLFFDQVPVPEFWEIRGSGRSGEIMDRHRKRAKIFYAEPKQKRLVKIVDWIDEEGKVRLSDHYDVYGTRFAQTVLDEKEKPLIKTYFTPDGREKIVENMDNGSVMVRFDDGAAQPYRIFKNRTDLTVNFLLESGLPLDSIGMNSLGIPFLVSSELEKRGIGGKDILFWQEKMKGGRIPANMQMIFKGETKRLRKVAVQEMDSLELLREDPQIPETCYEPFGFLYPFRKENGGASKILICTNSDQVEHLEDLVKGLPNFTFFVAAVTEMSQKLLDLAKYPNLKLFPNVREEKANVLFMEADYYLDINRGAEIINALEKAFLHDHIIIGFEETLHSTRYVAPENVCTTEEFRILINTLNLAEKEADYRRELLDLQHEQAMLADPVLYRDILN